MSKEMKRSWLVQRLMAPRQKSVLGDNPFAFGGGLRNGGLSDEAMGLLREIFGFDYMGAAEFEWGAVPKALEKIAKDAEDYRASSFTISLDKIKRSWNEEGEREGPDPEIFVICKRDHKTEVRKRIEDWATNSVGEDLKEWTQLSTTLVPTKDWHKEVQGWLELDNGFFFFVDREMWEKTAGLFGVRTD